MNTKVEFHKKTETILAGSSGCVWGWKADFLTQLTGIGLDISLLSAELEIFHGIKYGSALATLFLLKQLKGFSQSADYFSQIKVKYPANREDWAEQTAVTRPAKVKTSPTSPPLQHHLTFDLKSLIIFSLLEPRLGSTPGINFIQNRLHEAQPDPHILFCFSIWKFPVVSRWNRSSIEKLPG